MAETDTCRVCCKELLESKNRRIIFSKYFMVFSQLTEVVGYTPRASDGMSMYTCCNCYYKMNKISKIEYDLLHKLESLRAEKRALLSLLRSKMDVPPTRDDVEGKPDTVGGEATPPRLGQNGFAGINGTANPDTSTAASPTAVPDQTVSGAVPTTVSPFTDTLCGTGSMTTTIGEGMTLNTNQTNQISHGNSTGNIETGNPKTAAAASQNPVSDNFHKRDIIQPCFKRKDMESEHDLKKNDTLEDSIMTDRTSSNNVQHPLAKKICDETRAGKKETSANVFPTACFPNLADNVHVVQSTSVRKILPRLPTVDPTQLSANLCFRQTHQTLSKTSKGRKVLRKLRAVGFTQLSSNSGLAGTAQSSSVRKILPKQDATQLLSNSRFNAKLNGVLPQDEATVASGATHVS